MTDANINHLCPELLIIYREWLMQCNVQGLNVKAIVTWRSGAEQNTAKAKGLSNASAGQSPHNFCDASGCPSSKAFDFAVFDDNGAYITDGTDDTYRQAGEIGVQLGLEWGGKWVGFKDWDHLEMTGWRAIPA